MASERVKRQGTKTDARLTVGWQKLTKEEFLDALTVALLEKVRSRQAELMEASDPAPNAAPAH